MPLTDQERLDIFVDFLCSQDWNMPVQSFIEYYCIIFASENEQEHFAEKQTIYKEYKQVVGTNL
jgi:hypothetical protein